MSRFGALIKCLNYMGIILFMWMVSAAAQMCSGVRRRSLHQVAIASLSVLRFQNSVLMLMRQRTG